jgi:hypothetical protein
MNIAQSAASFVGTKSAAQAPAKSAAAPKSRKPSAPAAAPSIVASLAAQIVEAPKAAPAPKASKTPSMVVLTIKGAKFSPHGKSEVSKTKDQITWPKIVALFASRNEVPSADILDAIPEHRDYFGYALRSGWLAAA